MRALGMALLIIGGTGALFGAGVMLLGLLMSGEGSGCGVVALQSVPGVLGLMAGLSGAFYGMIFPDLGSLRDRLIFVSIGVVLAILGSEWMTAVSSGVENPGCTTMVQSDLSRLSILISLSVAVVSLGARLRKTVNG